MQLNPPGLILAEKPTVKKNLKKPESVGMRVDLKFDRETAQQFFPILQFDEGDTHVTISEVLRPAKPGEEKMAVMYHKAANVHYIVDHYEFEGHKIDRPA